MKTELNKRKQKSGPSVVGRGVVDHFPSCELPFAAAAPN